ncbi:hypothetical protein [Ligilactobacillus murinus]|uniref:hypothetical protein n=1 Tax=Ligilactobacillus murinus TaxID=1622 RepID=UPI0015C52873|nr:hypothetical protein [Ligilactobacillus murinus]ASD50592.1 hypothetical protein [Lactobacillus phage phiEF-1.1]
MLKEGVLLEFFGIGYGLIVEETEKTLLIRKCILSDGKFTPVPEATFVEKDLVKSAYWIKVVDDPELTETVDINRSVDLVSEFFDV